MSARALVQRYLYNVVAVDRTTIAKLFHVLRWTKQEPKRTIKALVGEGMIGQARAQDGKKAARPDVSGYTAASIC